MKSLLSVLLAGSILALPQFSQAQTNAPANPEPQTWVCLLFIGAAAIGGGIVIYAYANHNMCSAYHRLVLERDHFDDNWQPIATNVVYVSTNKNEVFRWAMNEDGARYRVRDEGKVNPMLALPTLTQ